MLLSLDLSASLGLLLFEMAWKSTVILGSVILVSRLLRRQSASLRQAILSAGVVVMLVSAAVAPALPPWTVTAPDWLPVPTSDKPLSALAASLMRLDSRVPEVSSTSGGWALPTFENGASRLSFTNRLPNVIRFIWPFIWLVGSFIVLGRLGMSLHDLRRLRRMSSVQRDEHSHSLVQDAARRLGLRRRITVLHNGTIAAPITWGIFWPVILLPRWFEQLPVKRCQAVLHHELSHVQRHDFVIRVLAELVCALLWFQPLAWTIRRQLREEQERACDDCVLAMGEKASSYARLLLEWQDQLPRRDPLIAVGVAQRSSLERRLHAILDQRLKRDPMRMPTVLTVGLLALSLALPLAALGFSKEAASAARSSVRTGNISDGTGFEARPGAKARDARDLTAIESTSLESAGSVVQREQGQPSMRRTNMPSSNPLLVISTREKATKVVKRPQIPPASNEVRTDDASLWEIRGPSGKQTIEPRKIPEGAIRDSSGRQTIEPRVIVEPARGIRQIMDSRGGRTIVSQPHPEPQPQPHPGPRPQQELP